MSQSFVFIITSRKMKFSLIKCYFILDQIKWLSFHTDEFPHLFLRFQTILFAHKCCVSKEEHF